MATTDRPTALVTGASGGIGEALARELAARGHDLVLVARSVGTLEALAAELAQAHGIIATSIGADLAASGAGRALATELRGRGLEIDIVVNNAGFADFGEFAHADLNKTMQMVALNVVTLTELTHELLPPMIERGRGRVMNLASTAAFLPGPLMAVYYATKAYVLSFSEGIAEELKGSGVTVTALCPGPDGVGLPGPRRHGGLQAGEGEEGYGRRHGGQDGRRCHGGGQDGGDLRLQEQGAGGHAPLPAPGPGATHGEAGAGRQPLSRPSPGDPAQPLTRGAAGSSRATSATSS